VKGGSSFLLALVRACAEAAGSFYRALKESHELAEDGAQGRETPAPPAAQSEVFYLDPDVARERELVEHIYNAQTGRSVRWANLPAEWKRLHLGDNGWTFEEGGASRAKEDGIEE